MVYPFEIGIPFEFDSGSFDDVEGDVFLPFGAEETVSLHCFFNHRSDMIGKSMVADVILDGGAD